VTLPPLDKPPINLTSAEVAALRCVKIWRTDGGGTPPQTLSPLALIWLMGTPSTYPTPSDHHRISLPKHACGRSDGGERRRLTADHCRWRKSAYEVGGTLRFEPLRVALKPRQRPKHCHAESHHSERRSNRPRRNLSNCLPNRNGDIADLSCPPRQNFMVVARVEDMLHPAAVFDGLSL
jgi:hypothetical protein